MLKGVIFDMDGVLVDNREAHIDAFAIFCERNGVPFERATLERYFGMGNDEIMPILLPAELIRRKGLDALAEEKEAIYREIYAATIEPVRGLVGFLHALRGAGIRTAVGSSGMKKNVDFVLERCGIADLFDAVVNGDMVTRRKPDPEIYLEAARLLGLEPSECVVIEDSLAGIESGHRAGSRVIALTTTFPREKVSTAHPEMIVADFTSLTPESVRAVTVL